jgi:hypothetical protein
MSLCLFVFHVQRVLGIVTQDLMLRYIAGPPRAAWVKAQLALRRSVKGGSANQAVGERNQPETPLVSSGFYHFFSMIFMG